MRLLLIISFILCSLFSFAQPGGYTEGTFVNWNFNGRDHGFFKSDRFDAVPDSLRRVVVHFEGDGETSIAGLTTQAPGKYLNDAGTNWDGKVVRAAGDTVQFMIITFFNNFGGYLPSSMASDLNYFFSNATNLPDTSKHNRYAITGFSGGPGRMWGTLLESGFVYANVFGLTQSISCTFLGVDVTAISSNKRNRVWRNSDDANGGTPESASDALFTDLSGTKDKKYPSTSLGHSADSAMSIYGTDSSTNFWRLVAQYRDPVPDTTTLEKIPITKAEVYNLTGYQFLTPQLLFDGDTSTVTIEPIYASSLFPQGLIAWVDLQGYYSKFRIRHNSQSGTGAVPVTIQFYKNWQDTTVKSSALTFNTTASWNTFDTTISKAVTDTFSFMKILIPSVTSANKFGEIEVYGKKASGVPPSLFVTQTATKPDRGLAFYGYGKVQLPYVTAPYYIDSTLGGMSIRWQANMDYVDTCTTCPSNAHTYVLNKYEDSYTLFASRLKNNMNFQIMPYWANMSPAFDIPGVGGSNKDIPVGSDSTLNASWINQRRMAKFMADSLKNLMETYEAGNEDEATWEGATRWHDPLSKLAKVHEFYGGVKSSNSSYNVSLGATPFRDSTHRKAMFLLGRFKYGKPNFLDSLYSINYNHYATTGGEQGGSNTDGVSPEQDKTVELWSAMKRFNDKYFPNSYMFWTEEGYDSLASNYNVPDISGKTDRGQTIAEWNLRTFDLSSISGLDGVYQFTQTNFGGGDFGSMGFVTPLETFPGSGVYINVPTRQFFYISAMKYAKQGYKGIGTIITNGDSTGVWVIEWQHATDATKKLRSVFRGTHDNSTTANYSMGVGLATSATTRKPTNNVIGGTTGTLSIVSNAAIISLVDETPVYVELIYGSGGIRSGLPFQKGKRHKWSNN